MARDDERDMPAQAPPDGRDDFSRFRRGSGEEPPPALDAAILRAAREAVRGEKVSSNRRMTWSLAASLLLSITAVLMFSPLEAPRQTEMPAPAEDRVRVESATAAEDRIQMERVTPAEDRVQVESVTPAENRVQVESVTPRVTQAEDQPQVESVTPAEDRIQMPVVPPDVQEAPRQTAGTASTPPPTRPQTFPTEAESAGASPSPPGPLDERLQTLEEITVTGSRIRRDEPQDSSPLPAPEEYRGDAESWRAAIKTLLDAGRADEAERERALFLQRYPDLDPG